MSDRDRRPTRRELLGTTGRALAGTALGASTLSSTTAGCLGLGNRSPAERARARREALSAYTDVAAALRDGYRLSTPYVRSSAGVLGLPFVKSGAPELDPETPNVLFYDLAADGTYELLGAEWFVSVDSRDEPPTLFGREFHEAMPGETALIPEHYGLHVWLFADNPAGLFARRHTGVTPPPYIDALETAWGALEPYYADQTRAVADGHAESERCIATDEGGYGYAFVHPDRHGTDPAAPAVLLYRFSSSWAYRLVGAEWTVPAEGPDAPDSPPTLFGQSFHEPTEPHDPETAQGRHYGLHAWLFAANPRGLFARFNPSVVC